MEQTVVTGMVLQAAPIGEYDRRVVLLTKERGRISAFAKGARRPNSSLLAAVNPFVFGSFTLYEGRNSNTLVSAQVSNYFSEMRENMEDAYYGFYFLELASYYTREGQDEREMLKLLYQSIRALLSPKLPNRLVRAIYELKVICINGEAPQVFHCVSCGKQGAGMQFCAVRGGLLCRECAETATDLIELDGSTIYTIQYIETRPPEKLYNFLVSEEVLHQLIRVMERYMEVYVGKRFSSLDILESVLENQEYGRYNNSYEKIE